MQECNDARVELEKACEILKGKKAKKALIVILLGHYVGKLTFFWGLQIRESSASKRRI